MNRRIALVDLDFHPMCMTDDERNRWLEMNKQVASPAVSPCVDCPEEWRLVQLSADKCNKRKDRPRRWKSRIHLELVEK